MAADPRTRLVVSKHARARLQTRHIKTPGVRFVLRHGVVRDEPTKAPKDPLHYICVMVSMSPEYASSREIAIACIPKQATDTLYIVSPYWVDPPGAGSIVGGRDV